MAGSNTKRSLSISVIVGTLLIPLSAVAAIWLTDPGAEAQAETTPDSTVTTTTPTTVETTQTTTAPISADLEMACGSEGLKLVDLEQAETISEVQKAALDALRGLCEQQGMPLPAPPAGEPVTRTVIVSTPAPREASTVTTAPYEDHDDEYDDEDHEEYEHEDEDHEEYEHEDDDHDEGHERESEHEREDDD